MELMTQLRADQTRIEKALADYAAQWPSYGALKDAMSYSLLSGGKRIRPALTLAVCRLFGGREEDALPFACGLEMVHTYSLIHDDLPCMDDDDFRRGQPTNHKVYGEANAVLAATAAHRWPLPPCKGPFAAGNAFAGESLRWPRLQAPTEWWAGQVLDLLGEGQSLTEEEITTIEALKTGCMIEAAARLGAIAANSTPEEEAAAAAYAREVGLAFQIQDDLLDVVGSEAEFGKPIGSDAAKEKSTFVALKGVEACQAWVNTLTEEAIACLLPFSGSDYLCGLARFLAGRTK